MPQLNTLVDDVYSLFNPDEDHIVSEENLEEFGENVKNLVRSRLKASDKKRGPLRFSALGKPDRQVWYAAHPDEAHPPEPMLPKTYFKFLYGDLIEQILLFLVKEAGHSVTDTQKQVAIDGITGSIDAIVDGVVVDVKSASPYGYKKFEDNLVCQDDPFGYVDQLSGYATVLTPGQDAAWLAAEKVSGDICVTPLPKTVIKHHDPAKRIAHLREVIEQPNPPERCYEDVEDGKSGNRKLGTACSYCSEKFRCWDNLRGFAYSNGPRYLTKVAKEPNVPEIEL